MRAVIFAAAVTALAGSAFAQTNTGEIAGVVRDASGGVVPGASIVAKASRLGARSSNATRDSEGRFYLPALRTGLWDVTASIAGFAPLTHKGLSLDIGRTLTR